MPLKENQRLVGVVPNVGKGNIDTLKAQLAELNPDFGSTTGNLVELTNPIVALAQLFHSNMTASCSASIEYASSSPVVRASWKATMAEISFRLEAQFRLRKLIAEEDQLFLLTPQDMLANALVEVARNMPVAAVLLFYPDVIGKLTKDAAPSNQLHHLFWNHAARTFLETKLGFTSSKLHSVTIPDLRAGFSKPETVGNEFSVTIKLSGSGGDAQVVQSISTALHANGLSCVIASERPPKAYVDGAVIPSIKDSAWFYHAIGEEAGEYSRLRRLITFPSEQVMHLCFLQQVGIPVATIFLYPRGHHEVMNLAFAINNGLSRYICVPTHLQHKVRKLLENAGLTGDAYVMLDPAEIRASHFKTPDEKWSAPAEAQPIAAIIKEIE